jgi:hypothetical protein
MGSSAAARVALVAVVLAGLLAAPSLVLGLDVLVVSDVGNSSVTEYASKIRNDSARYERCKATHRCNRATAQYIVDEGRYLFRKSRFRAGRQENADLFLDFENWQAGTLGLGVDHV